MAQDRAATQEVETIAATATPPGNAALGLVRLSGPRAYSIALGLLRPATLALEPRRATLARASASGKPIDQVLAVYFPGPHSATGEDIVEISAHGSPYILSRLLEEAVRLGARLAGPGEFTQRAFLNGRMDLAQAEAVCELIRARTDRAHRSALAQLEGGLSKDVGTIRSGILELLMHIEAVLDHPEEDLPALSPREAGRRLEEPLSALRRLAQTHQTGRLMSEGARICIVGRPNAGKSSLLNALLGRDRAIVSKTAGTTRDTIEEPADFLGFPAILIDTAGLREQAEGDAERSGLERTERALARCDLALLVLDGSLPAQSEDSRVRLRVLEKAAALGRPLLTVRNKCDLPQRLEEALGDVSISALSGAGLSDLRRRIVKELSGETPEETIVLSLRHHQALQEASRNLEEAAGEIAAFPGRWEDRAASRLRHALTALGEILGEGAPDELLRGIFAKFCIGK